MTAWCRKCREVMPLGRAVVCEAGGSCERLDDAAAVSAHDAVKRCIRIVERTTVTDGEDDRLASNFVREVLNELRAYSGQLAQAERGRDRMSNAKIAVEPSRLGFRLNLPGVWAAGVLVTSKEARDLTDALLAALAVQKGSDPQ